MPRQKQPTQKAAPASDIAAFRESLWQTLDRNAAGLSGPEVVRALKVISDEIYHAGIDEAYVRARVEKGQSIADAWDLTWVTALSIHLWRLQGTTQKGVLQPYLTSVNSTPSSQPSRQTT